MSTLIHAIYEGGVFRPIEPVDLPDHCPVKVEPDTDRINSSQRAYAQAEIYDILGERYNSGDPYGAERHNEHQA